MSLRHTLRASLESALTASETESELETLDEINQPEPENSITEDLDALADIETKVESLESLCETLESIGELSGQQVALANLAYGQIMSGTDQQGVSLEAGSFLSKVGESVTALLAKTREILQQIWRKIQDFIYSVFSLIPRRIKALEALKAKIRNTPEDQFAKEVSLTMKMIDGLSPGNVAFNFNNVRKAIRELQQESAWYFTTYSDLLVQTRRAITADFDNLESMYKAALPHYKTMLAKYPTVEDDLHSVGFSDYLPGGYRIHLTLQILDKSEQLLNPDEESAKALIGQTVYRTRVRVKRDYSDVVGDKVVEALPKRELLSLLDDAIAQLRLLESHRARYKRFCDETQRIWDTAFTRRQAENQQRYSNRRNVSNVIARKAMFAASFADWTKEPIAGLTLVSIRFSAAVAAYVSKCAQVTAISEAVSEPVLQSTS